MCAPSQSANEIKRLSKDEEVIPKIVVRDRMETFPENIIRIRTLRDLDQKSGGSRNEWVVAFNDPQNPVRSNSLAPVLVGTADQE